MRYNIYIRLLSDALEDKSEIKMTAGERIEHWVVEILQEALYVSVRLFYCQLLND